MLFLRPVGGRCDDQAGAHHDKEIAAAGMFVGLSQGVNFVFQLGIHHFNILLV